MATNITANTSHPANTQIVLRKGTGGTPLSHDEVDGNFITLMDGHNDVVTALGTKAASSHTHSSATASSAGFMSTSDKSKLDGIASSANNYSLPSATSSVLGGVKVGSGISVSSGTISVSAATTSASGLMSASDKSKLNGISESANNYSLPTATSSVLGGVKVGSGLSISNGTLSADTQSGTYSLPTASSSTLGGVKIGDGINITSGVIKVDSADTSLNVTSAGLSIDKASSSVWGKVKIGSGINVSDGVISVTDSTYTLPTASASVLGGVKVGTGLSISNGVLSATGGSSPSNLSATHLSLLNTASTGGADIEVGGADHAYIDLKNPQSDDYDLRIINVKTVDTNVHESNARLESSANLGFVAGASPSTSVPGAEYMTLYSNGNFRVGSATNTNLIKTDNTNNLIGLGMVPDSSETYGGDANYKYTGCVKDSLLLKSTDKTAKLKLLTTTSGGPSISLTAEQHADDGKGNYAIFIGGSNGYFNIKNEASSQPYSMLHSDVSGTMSFYPLAPSTISYTLQVNQDLGTSAYKWNDVWCKQGAFNNSDENLKQDIEDLSEAEKRVAVQCKGLVKKYRWKESVESKGENARIHIGIIAQELKAAFESEGLDAHKYGMFGEDTWYEGLDSEGEAERVYEPKEGYTKTTQLSVRYTELLAFIISAL